MLVLELAAHGDLRSFVKRTALAGTHVEIVGAQVASALAFLHQVISAWASRRVQDFTTDNVLGVCVCAVPQAGVVHRDVAARNVLVFAAGLAGDDLHVKLSDFGCACPCGREPGRVTSALVNASDCCVRVNVVGRLVAGRGEYYRSHTLDKQPFR
jgi:serine/threonine protein kinase